MSIGNMTKKIDRKIQKQSEAREEFDSFLTDWIEKHELPEEVYRGISYLMSSYVMNYIED
jgi:uncharacterized lipoprotein